MTSVGVLLIRPQAYPIHKDVIKYIETTWGWEMEYILIHNKKVDAELIVQEYEEHAGKDFYDALIASMTTDYPDYPICAVSFRIPRNQITDGKTWELVRTVCGPTNPEPGGTSVRSKFKVPGSPIRDNVVHSPDSREAMSAFYERWFTL